MKYSTLMTILTLGAILMLGGMVQAEELLGAGATFPEPLYSKMFDVYYSQTGHKINYQGIGSGGGIQQITSQTVDFGGTDAFLSPEQMARIQGNSLLHIPTTLGAVVVTYNLPGKPMLKLTPDVVADIFLGRIKTWNDARITGLNPGVSLPGDPIVVVHRSDGSGTSFVFTDYLSKVSPAWKQQVGAGTAVKWPVGLGGKGNPGVAGLVQQMKSSVGYVELAYAEKNHMPYAILKNKSGNFIKPSIKSVTLAANVALPDDTRASITDTDAKDGYPISAFTWILVYKEQSYGARSSGKAKALAKLLWWATHEGQQYCADLLYAPLPKEAVAKAEKILRSVTYNGQPILK
jgi:phosphate transport system substrate-binding protein